MFFLENAFLKKVNLVIFFYFIHELKRQIYSRYILKQNSEITWKKPIQNEVIQYRVTKL